MMNLNLKKVLAALGITALALTANVVTIKQTNNTIHTIFFIMSSPNFIT